MKKNLSKFLAFAILLTAVLGCSIFNKIQKEVEKTQAPQILTAADGSCQVTAPGNWKTQPNLNSEATIQAGNLIGELYIIVIREERIDLSKKVTLDYFTDQVRENFKQTNTDPVLSEPLSVTINGYPAKQFEAAGEVDTIKAKYLYATVETPNNYYQIITWTLASRYADNKNKLAEVVNSFKEVDASQLGSQNSNTGGK